MTQSTITIHPRFLGSEGEQCFTLQYKGVEPPKAHIVFVPPFGEEMNRCRALVAEQARNFAQSGYSCTVVDFYGTGDSQGELCDASLTIWQDNIRLTIDTLQQELSAPVILWGLRLGAFIALDFAAKSSVRIDSMVLWQPITSGERYVVQILRQRVAALAGLNLPPETTATIRKRLADGERVEVSGYTLDGVLMQDIEQLSLTRMNGLCAGKIHWMECVAESGAALPAASAKAIEALQRQHNEVVTHVFSGPPIWQLHKRDSLPELLSLTGNVLP